MRKLLLATLLCFSAVLAFSFSAWAQEYPKVELFGGYSYTRMAGSNWTGWHAFGVKTINHYLGAAFDVAYLASSQTANLAPYTDTSKQHTYTFLIGPELSSRYDKSKLAPFAHLLMGAGHVYAFDQIALGSTTVPFNSVGENHFMWLLGGGAEYKLKGPLALRGQLDYTSIRLGNSSMLFNYLPNLTTTSLKGWRFTGGLVLHIGTKTD